MSKAKRIFIALGAGLLLLALVWVGGRYGWRVLGFRACTGSGIREVLVTDREVQIQGAYPGTFPKGCLGWVTRQEGGDLYFGVRYDGIFGFFETGQFEARVEASGVERVWLVSGADRSLIWEAGSPEAEEGPLPG